ncbi:MAG: TrmB family transcriptional regulator [Candidatus Thorarchaeota archaeon]
MTNHLEKLLQELGFTQYEAQTLATLVRYKMLSAREIHKYSGVPQPKIYETMVKLQQKGFIEIYPRKKKKVYLIKPKEVIQEYLLNYSRKIQDLGQRSIDIIDNIYDTEETEEIPFIGIAGETVLQEYIYMLIDTAKETVISFLPLYHYDEKITSILNKRKNEIDIKLIFHDRKIGDLENQLSEIDKYFLNAPAFDIIKTIIENIENFLPIDQKKAYSFHIVKEIAINLEDLFGLMVIDWNKSFFKIPIPIPLPMAILSMLPQLTNFHNRGIKEILKASVKF